MKNVQQKDNESVKDYYRRQQLDCNPHLDEETNLQNFVKGLKGEIKLKVLSGTTAPTDMAEALREAIKFEEILNDANVPPDKKTEKPIDVTDKTDIVLEKMTKVFENLVT